MNNLSRSITALAIAIVIHAILTSSLWTLYYYGEKSSSKQAIKKEERIKISLKEMPKKHKKTGLIKKKVKPTPVAPPMPKGKQLKKLVKKTPVKYKPKKNHKTPKLNKPKHVQAKPKSKPKTEPLPPRKPYIPLVQKKKIVTKKPKDNTPAWMLEDKSKDEKKETKKIVSRFGTAGTTKEMKELYGEEWGKLTPGQKQYMIDNQEIMRRITQRILNRVARVNLDSDLNVNKTNVIEFYLHPNGDMTDFRFVKKSGYFVLDNTTKETIEYAYSQYPRPKEKILIRYNVFYNLARY